ncbi:E3 ubiquitin-protein ligase TRIM65-like [Leptodactylus fuscus]|uniref:E3 ubiquitin-protein ligase TRIM65-like n=1 Tax=Leptodactylus fuscus TaxID=238119 RepID=UPI003F4EA3D5
MEADNPLHKLCNNLNCSICLELFTNPLTLECGHNFCQKCIHEHWDRESATFTCPECRVTYKQRPEPQKNVSLSNLAEEVRALEKSTVLVPAVQTVTPAHNAVPTLCQRHHQELILYCSDDSRCICCKCLLAGCKQHDVLEIAELCQRRKKKLSNDLLSNDRQLNHTEEEMKRWKCNIENLKDSHEKMVAGIIAKFEQVRKTLDECQTLVVESVNFNKTAALTKSEEHVMHLQRHLEELERHQTKAKMLLMKDGVAFLEGLPQLDPIGVAPISPNIQLNGNLQMEAVTTILPEVNKLLQTDLPNLLHPEKPVDKLEETPRFSSGIAENDACCIEGTSRTSLSPWKTSHRTPTRISTLRAQLLKDYRNLTFNPETASKYIEISQRNCKATHKKFLRKKDMPNSSRRFQSWQVMCTEGFSEGSHYWEVDVSTYFVELGVAYGSLDLNSTIGQNSSSWSLQMRTMHHSAWHNNIETKLPSPMFTEIGIHIDMTAGTLAFYGIQDGSLRHLHSFSCHFSEKVFPVFWIGEDANVTIRTISNAAMDAETEG